VEARASPIGAPASPIPAKRGRKTLNLIPLTHCVNTAQIKEIFSPPLIFERDLCIFCLLVVESNRRNLSAPNLSEATHEMPILMSII